MIRRCIHTIPRPLNGAPVVIAMKHFLRGRLTRLTISVVALVCSGCADLLQDNMHLSYPQIVAIDRIVATESCTTEPRGHRLIACPAELRGNSRDACVLAVIHGQEPDDRDAELLRINLRDGKPLSGIRVTKERDGWLEIISGCRY